jgi:hypothetical protein
MSVTGIGPVADGAVYGKWLGDTQALLVALLPPVTRTHRLLEEVL